MIRYFFHLFDNRWLTITWSENWICGRKPNSVVHTYKNGFSGFAARLSEAEANSIAKNPGVVSVFPDPLLKLHTTHSWDFLKYQTDLEVDSSPNPNPNSDSNSTISQSSDTIIGILDTGEWIRTRDDQYRPSLFKIKLTKLQVLVHLTERVIGTKIQVFGQNQRVSMTKEWVQFHRAGRENAWKQLILLPPTATGKLTDHFIIFVCLGWHGELLLNMQ